jgi:hypothetical protein
VNDDDLVLAAYRVILNLVIPPLRARKLDDIKISWPCSSENSAADWTVAAFYFKRRIAFVIWCLDQNVIIGLPSLVKFRTIIRFAGLQEIFREPIADPRCHVKILDCVINLILALRANGPRK